MPGAWVPDQPTPKTNEQKEESRQENIERQRNGKQMNSAKGQEKKSWRGGAGAPTLVHARNTSRRRPRDGCYQAVASNQSEIMWAGGEGGGGGREPK